MTTSTWHRVSTLAAGGVVWRQHGLDLQVALVHRPRYDDWTLPKGKPGQDEPLLLAAVREVAEETGAAAAPGRRLATVEYPLGGDTYKRVTHWSMRYLHGEHEPSEEVDRIAWLTVAEATQRLTYPIDRGVLADFARLPAGTSTVLLLRHARAGKRTEYPGDDRLRPLDKLGRRQARELVEPLAAFQPARVLSAERVRCEQTVAPVAERLGLPVVPAPEFADEAYLADPARTVESLYRLAEQPGSTLICSQGSTIPGLLADLRVPTEHRNARKGSLWVLSLAGRRAVAGDYYPHVDR
ncbi:MAG TPA: NUDIX domain-containing protein [Jatrophihabitans sp.]|nr:NUDIX domain-containing protein [Jatrophihabitans sp.]